MKILIVDDNVAIQEIIRDILVDEGHNVRVAGTASEAAAKVADFNPDVVILDSKVDGEDGLHVLSEISEEAPSDGLNVILLKNATELSPKDNPFIRAIVDKPFKSSDIIAALRNVKESEAIAEAKANEKASKKSRRLFRRKKGVDEPSKEALDHNKISFGTSYVVFEQTPDVVYRFIGLFDPRLYDLMVVTTGRAKAIKEHFSYSTMDVMSLSPSGRSGSIGLRELGTMTDDLRKFIDGHDHPVIVFDTFTDIVSADGVNQALLMLHQLMTGKSRMCTFCISVDPSVLTDKDRSIILYNMVEFSFKE